MIRFANFEPDRIIYALDASTSITNAIPVADGWGPIPDIVPISDALSAQCLGAIYVRTSVGSYRLIAGTETGLYEFNATDYSWTDITGAAGPFAVPPGDRWSFEKFGDSLIAVNINDNPQYISIDSGTAFADLPGSPPKAKYVWTAGEFLVLGHHESYPNRIETSGISDASWWSVGERGCDYQDFPDGEEVMGGIGSEKGAIIFQRTKIRQMTIAQVGDYSFQTSIVNPNRGVISPLSIAQIGPGMFFYYSADGFFLGAEGKPIGAERVDAWFQRTFDSQKISEIRSVADPFRKIVWTQAEDPTGTKFLLGYNWQLDRWCYADNNVSEMCVMTTPGVSWDGLADLYSTIDDVDVPFDSALFSGGVPRFAAFDTSNRLGFFTGEAKAAVLETADVEINPGARTFLREVQTYGDCSDFTMQVGTSAKNAGTVTWSSAVSPYASTGICHFRSAARFHRFRLNIPAGADWTHLVGLEQKSRMEGLR